MTRIIVKCVYYGHIELAFGQVVMFNWRSWSIVCLFLKPRAIWSSNYVIYPTSSKSVLISIDIKETNIRNDSKYVLFMSPLSRIVRNIPKAIDFSHQEMAVNLIYFGGFYAVLVVFQPYYGDWVKCSVWVWTFSFPNGPQWVYSYRRRT
jgi:hypothetical protein